MGGNWRRRILIATRLAGVGAVAARSPAQGRWLCPLSAKWEPARRGASRCAVKLCRLVPLTQLP